MTRPLTLEETACEIGRSADWFGRNWKRLVAEQDFPPPILKVRRHYGWAPEHVQAWKDRNLPESLKARVVEIRGETPSIEQDQDNAVAEQRKEIHERLGIAS